MLHRKLYLKAKAEPAYRFYLFYDKIYRKDVLAHPYALAKANPGVPGVDGQNFWGIEAQGLEKWLEGIREELRANTHEPQPVRRVMIPKPAGGQRPLGIPTIRDWVLKIGARIQVTVRKVWLLMTLGYPWQGLFRQAWTQLRC
ncbi:MAG: hypothetical protein ACUVXB_17615 [Bryobacteraceae bacterium]